MKKQVLLLFTALVALVSSAQTFPVTLDIPDSASFANNWVVIDNNASTSANTWTYSDGEAIYTEDRSSAADDWLISSGVQLEAGVGYAIDYYVVQKSKYSFDKQKYVITAGTAQTIDGQSNTLATVTDFSTKTYSAQQVLFTPTTSGTYYFAIHVNSASYQGNFGFQKFVVDKAPAVPANVTDLAVAAGAKGALKAILTWTMPSTTSSGQALTGNVKARIMRGTVAIDSVTAAAGTAMSYTDEGITTAGTYKYSIEVSNDEGSPTEAATQVTSPWIGNDTPNPVTNLAGTSNLGNISLTWTPPTEGTHGGYIDTEALTYRIKRGSTALETAWTGTQPYADTVDSLAIYTYTVYVTFDNKTSSAATVDFVAGPPLTIPYTEDFSSEDDFNLFTLYTNTENREWSYSTLRGYAQYSGYSQDLSSWMFTPSIEMKAGKTYEMNFDTWLGSTSSVAAKHIYVTVGQGATIEAQTQDLYDENITTDTVKTKTFFFTVPADGIYNVGFGIKGATTYHSIYLDNISITEFTLEGPDVPKAPASVTLANVNDQAVVTWTPVTMGVHGVAVDSVVYRVLRMPDSVNVAVGIADTTFADPSDLDLAKYSYIVYATAGENEGAGTESNAVVMGVAEIPYDVDMTNADDMEVWTFLDVNGDGKTFAYSESDQYVKYSSYATPDDYAFTPPFRAIAGKYQLAYEVKGYNYSYSDAYEVVLTNTLDVAAARPSEAPRRINVTDDAATVYTVITSKEQNSLKSALFVPDTVEFTIAEDGVYYIGYHDIASSAWGMSIKGTHIKLLEALETGVNDLAVAADAARYNAATGNLMLGDGDCAAVYAVNGMLVARSQGGDLALSHLPAGVYVAVVTMHDGTVMRVKFVK